MLDKETFHPLNYIKKEEYSGSMDGMRYMLGRVQSGEEDESRSRYGRSLWAFTTRRNRCRA